MTRFGTDLRHQYGIFGGKSQTSFSQNATWARSEEGRLFSQATKCLTLELNNSLHCSVNLATAKKYAYNVLNLIKTRYMKSKLKFKTGLILFTK